MTLSRRDLFSACRFRGRRGGSPALAQRPAFAQLPAPPVQTGAGRHLTSPALDALREGRRGPIGSRTRKKFTEATGVEVRTGRESWEDIARRRRSRQTWRGPGRHAGVVRRPIPVPRQTSRGDGHRHRLGSRYGGSYPGLEGYAKTRTASSSPFRSPPSAMRFFYRESWVKEAGFSEFPEGTNDFSKSAKR